MTERTDADTSPVIDSEAPKLNCWEYKNCGRESTVTSTHELGVCPAAIAHQVDGSNSGHNGGRIC